jgi:hypothetical protein
MIFLCNRTRNEAFRDLKQAAKLDFAAVKVNVILISVTNQSVHVILFNSGGVHETEEKSLSLQFSSDIFTIIYKMIVLFMSFL